MELSASTQKAIDEIRFMKVLFLRHRHRLAVEDLILELESTEGALEDAGEEIVELRDAHNAVHNKMAQLEDELTAWQREVKDTKQQRDSWREYAYQLEKDLMAAQKTISVLRTNADESVAFRDAHKRLLEENQFLHAKNGELGKQWEHQRQLATRAVRLACDIDAKIKDFKDQLEVEG